MVNLCQNTTGMIFFHYFFRTFLYSRKKIKKIIFLTFNLRKFQNALLGKSNLTKIYSHTTINYLISFQEKKRKLFYHTSSQRYCKKTGFSNKKAKSLKAYRKKPDIEKKKRSHFLVYFSFGEHIRTRKFKKKHVGSIQ